MRAGRDRRLAAPKRRSEAPADKRCFFNAKLKQNISDRRYRPHAAPASVVRRTIERLSREHRHAFNISVMPGGILLLMTMTISNPKLPTAGLQPHVCSRTGVNHFRWYQVYSSPTPVSASKPVVPLRSAVRSWRVSCPPNHPHVHYHGQRPDLPRASHRHYGSGGSLYIPCRFKHHWFQHLAALLFLRGRENLLFQSNMFPF